LELSSDRNVLSLGVGGSQIVAVSARDADGEVTSVEITPSNSNEAVATVSIRPAASRLSIAAIPFAIRGVSVGSAVVRSGTGPPPRARA
jgi:hypothetical protein